MAAEAVEAGQEQLNQPGVSASALLMRAKQKNVLYYSLVVPRYRVRVHVQ